VSSRALHGSSRWRKCYIHTYTSASRSAPADVCMWSPATLSSHPSRLSFRSWCGCGSRHVLWSRCYPFLFYSLHLLHLSSSLLAFRDLSLLSSSHCILSNKTRHHMTMFSLLTQGHVVSLLPTSTRPVSLNWGHLDCPAPMVNLSGDKS
jgi:hypothetical protein